MPRYSGWRILLAGSLCLSLSGCDFGQWLATVLNAIGMAPDVNVRISGAPYFRLDAKDSKDGQTVTNGFLCVVHDPGCGSIGNNGTDTFFAGRILPPLTTITNVSFADEAPNEAGGIGGYGSYDATLERGPLDGSQPIKVRWHNACAGDAYGKPLYYQISFLVKTKKGVDLLEPGVAVATKVPACGPGNATAPIVTPSGLSGFEGTVRVCNPGTTQTTLHIEATQVGPPSGSPSSATSMKEDVPIALTSQGAGVWQAVFKTRQVYNQGTWQLTKAQVAKVTGPLAGLPRNQQLPGQIGEPILDFTGGSCLIQ